MFLNKTIQQLKSSNLGGTNIVLEQSELIKKYFRIRFKHEREAREFKSKQKLDLEELYESGMFYSLNERKMNEVYSIVSKLHSELSAKDQIQTMYNLLIGMFTYINARAPYIEYEEQIKIYWTLKIKAKREYKAFKDIQKIEQKKIRDELLDNGFVPQILSNAYSNIKLSISNFKELAVDMDMFRSEVMDQYKNSLELVMTEIFLEEIENV